MKYTLKNITVTTVICLFAISSIIFSCTKPSDRLTYSEFARSDNFGNIINVTYLDSIELPLVAPIKSISLRDSILLLEVDQSNWFVYSYNLKKNYLADSVAKRGQGPGEFISATASTIGEDSTLVVDNARMSWTLFHKVEEISSGRTRENAMNTIREISFPIISYIEYRPECSKLVLFDLSQNNASDSIVVPNIMCNGTEINSDFAQDYNRNNNTIALAFYDENKIMIGSIEDNKFNNISVCNGESLPNRICYTDIKVASNRIFALSQKNVNTDLMTGYSEIEVFDLNCNPLFLLRLPIICMELEYDEANDFIILQSAVNDMLYTMTLHPNQTFDASR